MNSKRFLLLAMMFVSVVTPSQAGIFFGKHTKADPAQRVPELVATLKTDQDERKRAAAAEELRDFDANGFPEIVAVLIDAVQHDPKPSVRSEAVQSLAKIRPVSQPVGMVIEEAADHDSSMRVRLQAKSSLLQYRWSGYRSPKKDETVTDGVKTGEPPLAGPTDPTPGVGPDLGAAGPDIVAPPPRVTRPAFRPNSRSRVVPAPAPVPPPSDGPDLSPPQ